MTAAKPTTWEFSKLQNRISNAVLASGLLIMLLTLGASYKSDGQARYNLLEAFFTGGALDEKYTLFLPVLAVPFYFALKVLQLDTHQWVAYFNFLFTVFFGWFVMRLAAKKFGQTETKITAILLLATSMLSHHLQWFFGEPTAALVIVLAYLIKKEHRWWSAALMALAIWSTPALLPVVALAGGVEVLVSKFKNFRLAVATVFGALFVLADTFIKFGSFSTPYLSSQEKGGFAIPSILIILAVLFSLGKGIMFFIPGLWLGADREIRNVLAPDRESKWVEGTFVAALVLVYSAWWAWYGGWFWGPRFFLVLCFPAALAFALALVRLNRFNPWQQVAIFALLALALWVGVEGYLFGQQLLDDVCKANDFKNESLCWYTLEYSALWNPFFGNGLLANFAELEVKRRVLFSAWQICAVVLFSFWAVRASKKRG